MIKILFGMICGMFTAYCLWGKEYLDIYHMGYDDARKTYSDYDKGYRDGEKKGWSEATDAFAQLAREFQMKDKE